MIYKLCRRCQKTITYPNTYCKTCLSIAEKEREDNIKINKKRSNQAYNLKRDKKYVRFYQSTDWKMLALKYMQDKQYRCELCNQIATQVHHVVEIKTLEGWQKRLEYSNLMCLCGQCHNKVHKRFM